MHQRRSGFSLVELLIVLGIVALLSTLAVAAVRTALNRARVAKTQGDLRQIAQAIDFLANDTGEWPGHQPAYVICTSLPGGCTGGNEIENLSLPVAGLAQTDGSYNNWRGPYMAQVPTDPWGNNYFVDTDYDIDNPNGSWRAVAGSYGPNGQGLNDYDSDDIVRILEGQ